MSDDSTLVCKGPCPDCGSSDACATYDDGHTYCFSCGSYGHGDGERTAVSRAPSDLIRGEYKDLTKRGIDASTCKLWGYMVGKNRDGEPVQLATYCDTMGEPVAQKMRTKDKEFMVLGSLKKAGLYGQHLWRSGGKKVIITEGEIDALTVSQAQANRWPVVSVPNGAQGAKKALAAQLDWLKSFEEIVLWFDNDEPGRDAAEECARILPMGKVKIITTPDGLKDANDLLREKGMKAVTDATWNGRAYRPDGIVTGEDLTVERLKQKTAPGWQTPYPKLNELTRGVRPRQLWLMVAGTGVGKSTDAREFAYHALTCADKSNRRKVGMMFLEESVEDTAKYLVALDNNVLAEDLEDNPDILTDAQWAKSHAALLGGGCYQAYDHFGATDSEGLLNKVEFMALNGAELIFLDHLTIAATGEDNEGVDKLMVGLRSIIERTGVSVIAIAHLRKAKSGDTPAEEGGQIKLDDIKGSGSMKQVPDVVTGKERDQQADGPEKDESLIRSLKVRRGGKTGPADHLRYNTKTGRLKPFVKATEAFDKEESAEDDPF
ncbi:toprim domain-containing protein [Variovorax sp. J22G73]|uniref:DnaB-like helicase C-terminal domain-containing protein n=1 Tax=unclassified Variovorax TaxID=663243 RepID=UPI0025757E36|nr:MULTISPECIES: toprim domain-containing protein [unclassified Variovorax]MDM0006465.1 toprim domain-containing protein [Variovorax sp. J22R203]MDM0097512.1 toprim domain-containing protein [Variovorax sp. J22G73]